jgi:hypothetical protein
MSDQDPKFEELRFANKQQWTMTNYALLALAAIYAIGIGVKAPSVLEKIAFSVIATLVGAFSMFLTARVQNDIAAIRRGLDPNDPDPMFRDWYFPVAQMGAAAGGALLVSYAISRSNLAWISPLVLLGVAICLYRFLSKHSHDTLSKG